MYTTHQYIHVCVRVRVHMFLCPPVHKQNIPAERMQKVFQSLVTRLYQPGSERHLLEGMGESQEPSKPYRSDQKEGNLRIELIAGSRAH